MYQPVETLTTDPGVTAEDDTSKTDQIQPLRGLIFDIQGHSVHDGPGTRTTVFLNSCPLSCTWCCNPEGLFKRQVILYRESRCACCGNCIKSCPHHAVSVNENGKLTFDRHFCDQCETHECVETCYHEGIELSGKYYTPDELIKIFQRDRQFWGAGGGVTFSGGEPLMQKAFILEMLKRCKKAYLHTCVETTSCLATDYYLDVMKYVDWVFTDLKHMDSQKHKELTGVGNSLILKNIKALAQKADWDGFIVPRIPVIPGVNDSIDNIKASAQFIKEIGLEVINILPFHRLGESKYRQLGKCYNFAEQKPPSAELMNQLKAVIEDQGLVCFVGHETPF